MDVVARLDAIDLSLFDPIESQTTEDDRGSLMALHAAAARVFGSFGYLEIGSHLGGSLQTFVVDPRCTKIVSIDPRPELQPDDRGQPAYYFGNSTERMRELLRGVPGAQLEKLITIERSTPEIDVHSLPPVKLCLIDGEHTERAALSDARFCLQAIRGEGVIVFHDRSVIESAIRSFLSSLDVAHRAYPLCTELFVIEIGDRSLLRFPLLRSRIERPAGAWLAMNRLGAPRLLLNNRVRATPALGDCVRARVGYWRSLLPLALGRGPEGVRQRPAPARALRLALSRRPQR